MRTITATEAARNFSHLLTEVRYRGRSFLIVRNGEPVASLGAAPGGVTGGTLGELLDRLEAVRVGDPAFADHLEEIQRSQPALPASAWGS